ncbi:MBL fold metallo-hydrolase [Naasia aerilata]|uniref:MBL fold metallo-hydrolase n=1 Tax=Naasia aerilata TaxID=1162966 RepID=A0ABM8GFH0_9MICO|nr:MBL fold metallo-hydrolase [Naasia aerilata]BDZ47111.1 MBL fold metallo-hydrolase [Naasia aerilata]
MTQRTRTEENKGPQLTRNVAPGIHRLAHAFVNCYLVEEGDDVTIVDAALPATWPVLLRALEAIGKRPAQVAALVLTHAHFDHLGFARRIQTEWNVPVWGHASEAYIARHPYRYAHEAPRSLYPLRHPKGIPVLGAMTAAGAWRVPGVEDLNYFAPGTVLDVPGRPSVVFSPGHTFGHCALHFPQRDALLSGDALVTLDPYTGGSGAQIVSKAATADSMQALASLDSLEATGASIVLPGHGGVWRQGIASATRQARAAGVS